MKRVLSLLLCLVLLITLLPVSKTTALENVSAETAAANIERLYSQVGGKLFTVNGQACTTHDRYGGCDNCKIGYVINSSWFKSAVNSHVPRSLSTNNRHYWGSRALAGGWTCCGFANYASWYIFAQGTNDVVTFTNITGSTPVRYNYATMQQAKPGDIIRVGKNNKVSTDDTGSHSAIVISVTSTGVNVLDANGGSVAFKIGKNTIKYSSYSYVTITRANNYSSAPVTPVNTANITSGTTYTVKNYVSGKYITVPATYNGSSNDVSQGHVLLNDASNGADQKIMFTTGSNGAWTLKPQTTSSRIIETYMADSSRSYAIAGDRISLFNSNSLSSECGQFVVSWVKEGVCALLLNGDRTLCLSPLTQAAASTNSDLYLTKYAGADWQLWRIYNPTGGSVVGDHVHKYTEWQHYSDVHWQVCSCGAKSNTAPHTWNSGVVTTQPTGSTNGVKTYTCTTCGRVKTETIAALGYTITVVSADDTMGTVSGGGKYSAGAAATITATAKDGYEFVKWNDGDTNASRTITVNADKTYVASFKQKHIHSYGEWQSDETNHWKECPCGNKSELAAHAWNDGVITTQPTGGREGIKTYTCATCKRTKTESLGYIIAITVNIDGSTINSMFSNTSYTYTCLENDNCTGMDAITEALIQNGYTYAGSGSYLSSVTSPNGVALGLADEKYGPRSGWMFTVNDSAPMLDDTTQARLDQYILKKGDVINFYYVECPTETRHHVRSADDKTKCSMCGMEMPIVYGDINGDGKVTSTDAGMLILYFKGRINISEEQLTAADVNGDGRVTSSDAGTTILYCKGKISSFPAYKN